jgi:hypothetical protein
MKTKVGRSVVSGVVALVATIGIGVGGSVAASGNTLTRSPSNGTEHLTIIESNGSSSGPALLRGIFLDAGVVVDNPDGVHSTFMLSRGTITVETTDNGFTFTPNAVTCLARFTASGNFTVIGGTGAYASVSGTGAFNLNATLVFPRTAEGCNFDGDPIAQVQVINGTGSLSLG